MPASVPVMARPAYRSELMTVAFFSVTLAAVESGVVGVFTKQTFDGAVPAGLLNFMVALIGASSEIANLFSFLWAALSHGRGKIAFINGLQVGTIVLVAAVALVPRSAGGLFLLAALVLGARACWSGIITLRPTVWRSNYPPRVRAAIVGKFSTLQQLIVATGGALLGFALDEVQGIYRLVVPVMAACGIVAFFATRSLRVRRHRAMLRGETRADLLPPWKGPVIVWRVLKRDRWFAWFMLWMFVLGTGNLMLTPILVITLRDQFQMGYGDSILIITTIPYLILPVAVPVWARLLDRAHVVKFRSIHGWTFAASTTMFLAGVLTHQTGLLYAAAAVQGVAFGGGSLAWNLGHVDFAPPTQTSQYMATHVTLNGVRGLVAPLVAVGLYEQLRRMDLSARDASAWVLGLCLAFTVVGAAGFVSLRRAMGPAGETAKR
ncbi:MAG: MFS transporter [Phycisphaerales bacterium]|nr:MFS transporter [Phycisphaerales bacterium]